MQREPRPNIRWNLGNPVGKGEEGLWEPGGIKDTKRTCPTEATKQASWGFRETEQAIRKQVWI